MKPDTKKQLGTVIDSIINEDTDTVSFAFHEYIRAKTQDILGEAKDEDDDSDESDDDSEEDDSEEEEKTKKTKAPSEGACGGRR